MPTSSDIPAVQPEDLSQISDSLESAIGDMSDGLGKGLDDASESVLDTLHGIGEQLSTLSDTVSASSSGEVGPSDLPPLSLDSVLDGHTLADLLSAVPELVAVGMGVGFVIALLGLFLGFMHRAFSVDDID